MPSKPSTWEMVQKYNELKSGDEEARAFVPEFHGVMCDSCGTIETVTVEELAGTSPRREFKRRGWVERGDENFCPDCRED